MSASSAPVVQQRRTENKGSSGREAYLRAHLRRQQHHPHADKALPSLDQRPGRTDEPHDQELAPAQTGDATLKIFHYPDIESLKAQILAFVKTYNFAKRLKALRWKTPFEAIGQAWTKDPSIFNINPRHLIPRPNIYLI